MQEKSIIKQNILKYLDFKGISPYKFYQDSGITRGVLSQNNGMSEENTTKFLAYCPSVNIEWLLTGKEPMLKSEVVTVVPQQEDSERIKELKYTIDLQRDKIIVLEKELSELKDAKKEPFLYTSVAEPTPELIKKESK